MGHRHPVNQKFIDEAPLGARVADTVVGLLGSWRFIIAQSVTMILWVAFNSLELTGHLHYDAFPFILLNLALSTQAGVAGPLILLASNRSSTKDRLTLEHTAAEADRTDAQNVQILEHLSQNTALTLAIVRHLGLELDELTAPHGA